MLLFFQIILLCAVVLSILMLPAILIVRKTVRNRSLLLAAYVLTLVFFVRLAVGWCASGAQGLEIAALNRLEKAFDSLVHALQTFSLDEDYTKYVTVGKDLLENAGHPVWAQVYGLVGSVLNVSAPILGGALLLDILAGIFPYIRVHMHPFRHKLVFSELNDASITLAEDFVKEKIYRKYLHDGPMKGVPVLIFTDAYPDETSEPRSELMERAEAIHGICVKTDLLHLPMRRSRSVSYFLMDRKNGENISTIARLLKKDENGRYLWPASAGDQGGSSDFLGDPATKIYVFTESDTENEMTWQAAREMEEDAQKVLIRPIRDYMNAAICQMFDAPLFLPLMGREKPKNLYVTVIGSGTFAEEALKAAFWCGQIQGVQLHIDVLTGDADTFRRRLDDECPELFACSLIEFGESIQGPSDGVLTVFPNDPARPENPPYCIFRFFDIDDPVACMRYPKDVLDRTDYYIIALGEDERNLQVSAKIRRQLLRMTSRRSAGHAVLAPVVYNGDLAALARKAQPAGDEPYVLPFADLCSRFSYRNVLMDSFLNNAEKDGELYNKAKQEELKKDEYTHWANLARAVHHPYKLFGLGILRGFNADQEDDAKYRVQSPYTVTSEENEELAWVEHRRWNAFMRTQGFSCPSQEQYRKYYRRHCEQGHPELTKDVGLRFHPCLVERSITATAYNSDDPGLDKLDLLKIEHGKDYKQFDYKEYDADLMKYLR